LFVTVYRQGRGRPKKEKRLFVVQNLDHTPRPGEEIEIDGDRWHVAEWTDRIECERGVN
jgi:hypothetical protein